LRQEVGPARDRLMVANFYGLSVGMPSIHPWVERLISEAAEIDVSIVAAFMAVERELTNMRHYLSLFQSAATKQQELQDAKEQHTRAVFDAWVQTRDVQEILKKAPEGRIQDWQQAAEFAEHFYLGSHREVLAALAELEGKLATRAR